MESKRYQDINAETINRWVSEGWEWGKPIDHETYKAATEGRWQIVLTPTKPVPRSWFPPLQGTRVLGLAAGGGQQMPVLAAAGARCTVLDQSEAQLASERLVAEREGYSIEIVKTDMTQGLPFADASFDTVLNPVSLCYVRECAPIFQEVARVLVPGGAFLAGFDFGGFNYVVDEAEERIIHSLPFDPVADPSLADELTAQDAGMQFSHSPEEILGGMLHAGLVIDDVSDDTNGEGRLHEFNIPTMLAVKAHKA